MDNFGFWYRDFDFAISQSDLIGFLSTIVRTKHNVIPTNTGVLWGRCVRALAQQLARAESKS